MKMIGFEKPFKLEEGNLFKVYEQRKPTPENDDILVKVNSISVNPVDTKQRQMEVTPSTSYNLGLMLLVLLKLSDQTLHYLVRVTLYFMLDRQIDKDQMRHINWFQKL